MKTYYDNNLIALRSTVEQLKNEKKVKREKTSKTIEDMKHFIQSHQATDRLVTGFYGNNSNPYKTKNFRCDLI
jgi:hypothetical protein